MFQPDAMLSLWQFVAALSVRGSEKFAFSGLLGDKFALVFFWIPCFALTTCICLSTSSLMRRTNRRANLDRARTLSLVLAIGVAGVLSPAAFVTGGLLSLPMTPMVCACAFRDTRTAIAKSVPAFTLVLLFFIHVYFQKHDFIWIFVGDQESLVAPDDVAQLEDTIAVGNYSFARLYESGDVVNLHWSTIEAFHGAARYRVDTARHGDRDIEVQYNDLPNLAVLTDAELWRNVQLGYAIDTRYKVPLHPFRERLLSINEHAVRTDEQN